MIPLAGISMMLSCPTHSLGLRSIHSQVIDTNPAPHSRARRNARGDLEPDAPEHVVQSSLGFGDYKLASKKASDSGKSFTSDTK